ncbi:MAG: deoxyribodipyrimidine photo-lyase, partial [Solirubrobacterales bacterium]|nr:deoxyribodipyrimidine photo-lyase [Solirubrobacterales bacterium]
MTALLWLRRDLRLHDHPALRAALDHEQQVVPVFCLDPRLLSGRHASGPRTQFLLECLADLDESLRRRGSGLVVRNGLPEQVVPQLARELDANRVFWTSDVGPLATRRDRAVGRKLEAAGAEVRVLPGLFALDDPKALLTLTGHPHRVFTPFHRAWLQCARREVLPAPSSLPALSSAVEAGRLPTLLD